MILKNTMSDGSQVLKYPNVQSFDHILTPQIKRINILLYFALEPSFLKSLQNDQNPFNLHILSFLWPQGLRSALFLLSLNGYGSLILLGRCLPEKLMCYQSILQSNKGFCLCVCLCVCVCLHNSGTAGPIWLSLFLLAPSWSRDGFRSKKFRIQDPDFPKIWKNPDFRVFFDKFG